VGFSVSPDLVLQAQHDDAALEGLLTLLWPEAYRVAFGVLHDRGLAEDAAQEACASIARALPVLRSNNAFYTWAYRIIVRHATVSAKRRRKMLELDTSAESPTASSEDERLDLLDAIAALPIQQRTVVVLRYYTGFNSSEIAAVLRVPAPTVRFNLMLARRALRAALAVIDSMNLTRPEVHPYVQ
jgi:RNA polymerase sigma-70 factor (ECF subfamily)